MPISKPLRIAAVSVLVLLLAGCGYNQIQTQDEAVSAAWSEVLNQYKRRADLIPNLVKTVQGYAEHERQVLTEVTEARAKANAINVNANDPASLQQFQAAQGALTSALSRLMVVVERYPNLKADQSFINLQTQLEGTENRIAVARGRYIKAVQDYNGHIRQFPVNLTAMVFGYETKPNFTVENETQIQEAPSVDFGQPAPPAASAGAPTPAPAALPVPAAQPAPAQAPAPMPLGQPTPAPAN